MLKVINGVFFYLGWFVVLWAATTGRPYVGVAVVIAIMAFHLAYISKRPISELLLMLVVAVLGLTLDSCFQAFNLLEFVSPGPIPYVAPLWVGTLYVLFASSIHNSLAWLRHRPLLSAPLGAVGGPLSYRAGSVVGAVEFPSGMGLALGVIAVCWLGLYPLLDWLATRIDSRYE